MKYTVELKGEIDFAPQNETAEILQNVRTILNTIIGTVPLDRVLGISCEHLDKPIHLAKTQMMVNVIDALDKHEPRVRVQEVRFNESDAAEGILTPVVIVAIGEDEEEEGE